MQVSVSPSASIPIGGSVRIVASRASRKQLMIYNNSANTIYCKYGSAGSSSDMSFPIPTFTTWVMPTPMWPGEIWASRNSGSGVAVVTDVYSG